MCPACQGNSDAHLPRSETSMSPSSPGFPFHSGSITSHPQRGLCDPLTLEQSPKSSEISRHSHRLETLLLKEEVLSGCSIADLNSSLTVSWRKHERWWVDALTWTFSCRPVHQKYWSSKWGSGWLEWEDVVRRWGRWGMGFLGCWWGTRNVGYCTSKNPRRALQTLLLPACRFIDVGGYKLLNNWLTYSKTTNNIPLLQQILLTLQHLPLTVDHLKQVPSVFTIPVLPFWYSR